MSINANFDFNGHRSARAEEGVEKHTFVQTQTRKSKYIEKTCAVKNICSRTKERGIKCNCKINANLNNICKKIRVFSFEFLSAMFVYQNGLVVENYLIVFQASSNLNTVL